MTVCSHQPTFLPWIGFWNKLALSDVWVALLGVQYSHHDVQNRVRFMGGWLTLPVHHATKHGRLDQVEIRDLRSIQRIGKTIRMQLCNRRFPYHERLKPVLKHLEEPSTTNLASLNLVLILEILRILKLKTVVRVSQRESNAALSKTQNMVACLDEVVSSPAACYLAGAGAREYLDKAELPFPVLVQKVREVSSDSILQLIAQEPDPLTCVLGAAEWNYLS